MFCDAHISERIKNSRASLGFSQGQLAAMCGIAPAQLYRYEAGRTVPRPDMVGRIATALDVSTAWLAKGELPMQRDKREIVGLPTPDGISLMYAEFPDDLMVWIKNRAIKNFRTTEMEMLYLLKIGIEVADTTTSPQALDDLADRVADRLRKKPSRKKTVPVELNASDAVPTLPSTDAPPDQPKKRAPRQKKP